MVNLGHLYALSLAGLWQFATAADSTTSDGSTISSAPTASTAGPAPTTIEIDVVFPRSNQTYNHTEAFPVVIVIRNLAAAAPIAAEYWVDWTIMPWGRIDGPQEPSGFATDMWMGQYTTGGEAPSDEIWVINNTNTREWEVPSRYPFDSVNGSVYALALSITWSDSNPDYCNSGGYIYIQEDIFFAIDDGAPEPDLLGLGECPELGLVVELDTSPTATLAQTPSSSSCRSAITGTGSGNPCAIIYDDSMAMLVSSAWASAAASTTSSTTSITSTTNAAAAGYTAPPLLVAAAALVLL